MTIDNGVHGAVNVQQHAVFTTPVGQTGVSSKTTSQEVMHHNRRTDFLGELGTPSGPLTDDPRALLDALDKALREQLSRITVPKRFSLPMRDSLPRSIPPW